MNNEYWNCPHCDKQIKTKGGKDNGGWVGKHLLEKHGIGKLEHIKMFPHDNNLWPHSLQKLDRISKINSDDSNRVQCLECGEYFFKISNTHLLNAHNMNTEQYKIKYPTAKINSDATSKKMSEIYYSENGLANMGYDSKGQLEVLEYVRSLGFPNADKHRSTTFDVDILIPEKKIAIEYHGLFHHSEFNGKHGTHTHLNRTLACEKNGIQLIHIFEDEWLNKREIVKSRIKSILKIKPDLVIYARQCTIEIMDSKHCKKFLEDNHLQGYSYAKYCVVLKYDEKIVQCMTFTPIKNRVSGKILDIDENIYENVRLCTKMNTLVIAGANRLLSYFEKNINPKAIHGFIDRRWGTTLNENIYDILGFTFIKFTNPAFWGLERYIVRKHRSNFTKPVLIKKYPNITGDTQKQMIKNAGFDIIWDCGQILYRKDYAANVDTFEHEENEDILQELPLYNLKRRRIQALDSYKNNTIKCEICNELFSVKGLHIHVQLNHGILMKDYIEKYGEYRKRQIDQNIRSSNTNILCKICGYDNFVSHQQFAHHVKKMHGIDMYQYVKKMIFNNEPQICECGCGNEVAIKIRPPYRSKFITGHNSRGETNPMFGKRKV